MSDFFPDKSRFSFWPVLRYSIAGLIVLSLGSMSVIGIKQIRILAEELEQLKASLQVAPDIAPIEQQLLSLRQQIDQQQSAIANADIVSPAAIDGINQQLAGLEQRSGEQVARADALSLKIQAIEQRLQQQARLLVPPTSTAPVKPRPKSPAQSTPVSKAATAAPFVLIATEQRGGISFAALAPAQSTNLAQIDLLGNGQTLKGWTLLSIDGQQARFRVAGQMRTLTVK